MADGGGDKKWANFVAQASAMLKGKKNAGGKGSTAGNRSALASAIMKANAPKRNALLAKFGLAYGAPAAAGAAAGVAVANAVAGGAGGAGGAGALNSANKKAAQDAIKAALEAAGSARKPGAPQITHYARLMKNGKEANAKEYLAKVLAKAAEMNVAKTAKAAAGAAAKTARANATPSSNENIKARIMAAGAAAAGPVNVAYYRQARMAGKNVENAVKNVFTRRANAHKKAGAARTAKALAKKAAAAGGVAGAGIAAAAAKAVGETLSAKGNKKKNMATNTNNLAAFLRNRTGKAPRPGSVAAGKGRKTRRRRN